MKHVGPCLTAGNDRESRDSPLLRSCEARASLLKCQERPRKKFLPRWRPCEGRASLFLCGKDHRKPF